MENRSTALAIHRRGVLLASFLMVAASLWTGCSHSGTERREPPAESQYVGAQVCAECHADIFQSQSKSPHALTLRPATADGPEGEDAGRIRLKNPETGVEYRLEKREGQLHQVRYENGRETGALSLAYFLGSGQHGVSPMGRDDSGWKYLALTYYAKHGWDFSPMHGLGGRAARADNPDGFPVPPDELEKCWGCHSTRLEFTGSEVDTARSEMGVRCESCHGPGRAHVEKTRAGAREGTIQNPRTWSSESFMALCQQCHNETSTLEGTLMGIPDDPADPSVAKYHVHGMQQSRCFTQSGGALRCTTCHNPHGDGKPQPAAFYEGRCQSCHSASAADQSSCPVNPTSGCLTCHMPKVEVEKYTRFADHWIRARSPFAPASARAGSPHSPR